MHVREDIDQVYVVHCRHLPERRRALEPVLHALGWRDACWILDFDPEALPSDVRTRVATGARLRTRELSVYLKHERVFQTIATETRRMALVLEDDAILLAGFRTTLARHVRVLPAGTGLAYLGASCGLEIPPDEKGGLFGSECGTRSMSAVLVRPDAARVVAEELARRPIAEPVDLALNEIIRARRIPVVWSVPALVPNGSETGRFPHSLGVGWRSSGWLARLRCRSS